MLFINNVEGLFKNHYRPLCLYATHFIGDIDMAEDIVMDCFVKYAELLNNGEKIKLHKSYLYQINPILTYKDIDKNNRRLISCRVYRDFNTFREPRYSCSR